MDHERGIWIDGGNDMRWIACECERGEDHADDNPWS